MWRWRWQLLKNYFRERERENVKKGDLREADEGKRTIRPTEMFCLADLFEKKVLNIRTEICSKTALKCINKFNTLHIYVQKHSSPRLKRLSLWIEMIELERAWRSSQL